MLKRMEAWPGLAKFKAELNLFSKINFSVCVETKTKNDFNISNLGRKPSKSPILAKTQGKIDLRNESGRPMKLKVVGEVSEK